MVICITTDDSFSIETPGVQRIISMARHVYVENHLLPFVMEITICGIIHTGADKTFPLNFVDPFLNRKVSANVTAQLKLS